MGFFLAKTWPFWLLAALLAVLVAWLIHRRSGVRQLAADPKAEVRAAGLVTKVDSGNADKLAAQEEELLSLRGRLADLESDEGELVGLRSQVSSLQGELDRHRLAASLVTEAAPDVREGARVLGFAVKLDDLKVVEGIGPKIEGLLHDGGIRTWSELSHASTERLQEILDAAGPRYQVHNPATWPRQAAMLVSNDWSGFKTWTEELTAGREKA